MNVASPVPVITGSEVSQEGFRNSIQSARAPCVLRGVDIGPCKERWSADYLCTHGSDVPVKVHVTKEPRMDFLSKNYVYRTLPFKELVLRASQATNKDFFISDKEFYYLRSLGENVRKDVADIKKQFPKLSEDINFPDFFPPDSFFSSVFRIASAQLQLWTHYDIMDNLLIQVRGKKRVVLFPPSDVEYLYLDGDKSRITDLDNVDFDLYPLFAKATRFEAILQPGDILFIPALWFHNVVALEFGVAVNVFWKNLNHELYDKKDPYGNKDLIPATRAMDSLRHALKVIDSLPRDYKDFYGRRIVEMVKAKTYKQCD